MSKVILSGLTPAVCVYVCVCYLYYLYYYSPYVLQLLYLRFVF